MNLFRLRSVDWARLEEVQTDARNVDVSSFNEEGSEDELVATGNT